MEILLHKYFEVYKQQVQIDFSSALSKVKEINLDPRSFTFYTSVAVISSSKIEGEQLEIDSYVKHKIQDVEYLPELVEKPNDLFQAYLFAGKNNLNNQNFLQAHQLLSKHLLPERWRGVYRQNNMLVMEHGTGRIQYEAPSPDIVKPEMDKLWNDIGFLLEQKISTEEIFYYASYIHLVFVNIHPFTDGNGRAGRLMEKWFLTEKLGEVAWFIQSEKYYYKHVDQYYKNLNRVGMFYDKLDYAKAENFLQMLPNAIHYKG